MRVCVSCKYWLALIWLFCLLPSISHAECCTVQVKQAELTQEGQSYLLSADIDYQLSGKALQALQNGVPLFWDIKLRLQQPREFIWAKNLAEAVIRYRLQYHALLNLYRVKNESTGNVDNVSTLSAALNLMSTLRNFHILDHATVTPTNVEVALKVEFDREALPLPLRPMAYLSQQWDLSSEWSLWSLKN